MSAAAAWRVDEAKVTARTVVVVSADAGLRERLRTGLAGMRWTVIECAGGAAAMARVEVDRPEALVVDSWLPDLEVGEFTGQMGLLYGGMDVLRVDGRAVSGVARSPRRNELLHAIREAEEVGGPVLVVEAPHAAVVVAPHEGSLPEMVGESAPMRELARLIRLVARRTATVLIEGETGTGKEVVAKAVASAECAGGQGVCGAELRGDSGKPARGGVIWAYARSVYGSGAEPDGTD